MDRLSAAACLREIAALLRLSKGRSFRARAFERAALAVESLPDESFAVLLREGRLCELEGVGDVIARQITDLSDKGHSRYLDDLREQLPRAVFALASIPGVSLTKATKLHQGLGIGSVEALADACRSGLVRSLSGFGVKTEASILTAIETDSLRTGKARIGEARRHAETIIGFLERSASARAVHLVGDLRRWVEVVDSIDVVCATATPGTALEIFSSVPFLARFAQDDESSASATLYGGLRVRLWCVRPESIGTALVIHTGSVEHVSALESRARARGLVLASSSFDTEEALYRALGLPFIPPEIREDIEQLHDVLQGTLRLPLVERPDIRGMIHCHTVFSDGRETVEAMAQEARARGYGYITMTDHSPSAHYAGGVDVGRLEAQWADIARARVDVGIGVLRGTESDILKDGGLDYAPDILEQLDVIIASVHSRFKLDANDMTRRLIRAMKNPFFKIWGHPLGRLLLRREPIACDVEAILDAVAESRAAIEINGDPFRLDLEPRWIRKARARGIRFVISTDAHSRGAMGNIDYGVAMARRGGLTAADVLNTLEHAEFIQHVRPTWR